MVPKIARNPEDFDFTLDSKTLNEANYDDYFVMTKEGRGEDPTSKLIRKFNKMKRENLKILFSGFKGCGKSTELLRLKRELENDFLIRVISVIDRLDSHNLTVAEILVTVMTDLFEFANQYVKEIKLSKELLENLESWADSIYTEEINYEYYEGKIGLGTDIMAGFGIISNKPVPRLLRVLFSF